MAPGQLPTVLSSGAAAVKSPAKWRMQRRYRLRGRNSYAALQRDGRRWRHPLAILLARPNSLPHSRFGFVASSRLGNAVVRNRARRRLREAVRLRLAGIVPGWDCLFIARSGAREAPFAEIEAAVEQLLHRARLWRRPASEGDGPEEG